MQPEPEPEPELEPEQIFSVARVAGCLPQPRARQLRAVEVVHTFESVSASVARLKLQFDDGGTETVVGKGATGEWNHGAGLRAVRRELRFLRGIATRWQCPCAAVLGTSDVAGPDGPALFLTEDLAASSYTLVGGNASSAQLQGAVDGLIAQHAAFWQQLQDDVLDHANPSPALTQSAHAWPPQVITMHAEEIRRGITAFLESAGGELVAAERALLVDLLEYWEKQFLNRVSGGCALTLLHADYHVLGNVLFRPDDPAPKVIDWSELKPGLGPHDVAYLLISVPSDERATRDETLLRRYWDGLRAAGHGVAADYPWEWCQWDYRFSLCTILFQSVFQMSLYWFRKTAAVVEELDCTAALHTPHTAFALAT